MNNRLTVLSLFLVLLYNLTGCTPATTDGKKVADALAPGCLEAVPLFQGVGSLADKLVASTGQRQIGKITVADFVSPNDMLTPLGEHIADKLSVKLFASGRFDDFMERRQLKQVMLSKKMELSGAFDQKTVQQFGQMLGVDAMVIGTVQDLGAVIDVTAKIIDSATGRMLGVSDVQISKDSMVNKMLVNRNTGSLTISVDPPVSGKVSACGQQGYLQNGIIILHNIPYGPCAVVINSEGNQIIHKNVNIRSASETLGVRVKMKRYTVSFQVIPANASLTVDGKNIPLNEQGYAKIADLEGREYSFVISAEKHKKKIVPFNPAERQNININLETDDPFLATGNQFARKYQEISNKKDFDVQLWTNKIDYRLGEPIYFYFKAERECYVNLVDINSKGEMTLLFPNQFNINNRVRGGRTYQIPGDDYGFTLEAQPPTGIDRIYAIVSTRPIGIFNQDFSRNAFQSITRGNTRGIGVKGIGVRLDQAKLNAAAEHVIHIR